MASYPNSLFIMRDLMLPCVWGRCATHGVDIELEVNLPRDDIVMRVKSSSGIGIYSLVTRAEMDNHLPLDTIAKRIDRAIQNTIEGHYIDDLRRRPPSDMEIMADEYEEIMLAQSMLST